MEIRLKLKKSFILMVSALVVISPYVASTLYDEGVPLFGFRDGIEFDPHGYLANWEPEEGRSDPCSWNGVGCEHGRVVSLILESRCLKGTLSSELGKLIHLKYLVLHNNSLYGTVPREIGKLVNLEILDLGYNNLAGSLPPDLGNLLFLEIFVVSGNRFIDTVPLGHPFLELHGEVYIRGNPLSLYKVHALRFSANATIWRLLQVTSADKFKNSPKLVRVLASASNLSPAPASSNPLIPPPSSVVGNDLRKDGINAGVFVAIGLTSALLVLVIVYFIFVHGKNVTIKPWATGLSGQLQHALKKGIPALKRYELEIACEDFSNIIGSLSDGKLYKGTLSSGVEIAVSVLIPWSGWSKHSQAQFKNKIEILSKVNHKNFVNLLGYCEEDNLFTRMMVFEYAPNGMLFEHLHVRDSQDLSWAARLRIAMGVAYCLEHMHQMNPPIVLKNLNSNLVHLTDDFAAKVVDFELWSGTAEYLATPGASWSKIQDPRRIVLKFGILLLELVSGKPPYSDEDGGLVNWANDYLKGLKPLRYMVDPSLNFFNEIEVMNVVNVVKACLNPDPSKRWSMKEVVEHLRDITSITPEAAAPKLSPLWWAELEIMSSEG